VEHLAVFGAQGVRCDIPVPGRGRDQHGARPGARVAQRHVGGGGAHAAAGELHGRERHVEGGVGRREFHLHARGIDVELLGGGHGEAGVHALAHLRLADDHGHGVVGRDPQEGIGLEHLSVARGGLVEAVLGEPDAHVQAGADDRAADQETAPVEMGTCGITHGELLVRECMDVKV
jgi:hypothetical protein